MFGCWVILVEKCNFHTVFSMVYESIVNDVNGSIVHSSILRNVDSSVLKVFCMVNSVYFVQDNSLNNYFRSSDFSLFFTYFWSKFFEISLFEMILDIAKWYIMYTNDLERLVLQETENWSFYFVN